MSAAALKPAHKPSPLPRERLTHLQQLEAESIQIMREVVSETERPVMLYSIGKDSAVMLHLAAKAFYPSPPPFPLLHVDTTWKFKAMYDLREQMAKTLGMELLVHKNPEAVERGINPFDHGSALHTDMWKTEGLKQALDKFGFTAAFGGARRDEEKSRAKERIFSFRSEPAAGTLAFLQYAHGAGRDDPGLPDLQLDRAGYLAIHPPGKHPDRAAVFLGPKAGGRARRHADHGR
jgi:sulfate adenylyltransferase subunit 2